MWPPAFRLLASLGVALAVLLALGLAPACQDPGAKIAEHQERGEGYLEDERYEEATLEFRNVLQIDPNHAGAHWGLARAYVGSGQLEKAYWELQETIRLDPEHHEARLRFAQLSLFGEEEQLEEAVESADAVIEARPAEPEAYVLKGRALERLDRPEEAGEAYAAAVEAAPEEPAPRLLLADFHRRRGNDERAETLLRELTELEPSLRSYEALGRFLAAQEGRAEEAESAYRKALEHATAEEEPEAYTALANFLFREERYEDAERVLRGALEEREDDARLLYGLARFYHARGRSDEADAMMERAAEASPDEAGPHLLLSAYRGRRGDLDGALQAAEAALEIAPESDAARLRKAEVLVDVAIERDEPERLDEGRATAEAVIEDDPGHPEALFVLAKIDLAEGEPRDAEERLRRALERRAGWARARFLLGSALYVQRDLNGARAELARALEHDAKLVEARRLLARVHAALGEHQLAVQQGRRVLERRPGDTDLRVLVAQSLVRQRRTQEALDELEGIPEEARDASVHYALGRVRMLRGEPEAARRELLAALDEEPTHHEVLRALLDLDVRQDRLADSAERIRAAVEEEPEDPRLVQLLGEVSLYTGDPKQAEKSFRRAIELDPNDLRAYQSLARYLAVTGRPGEVMKTYERALERNPDSATLHLIVGSLYELRSEPGKAMERYEEAIRLDADLAVAKNNLAYLIAERGGDLDRALELAQSAKRLLPDNPSAADTLGWVLYKKEVPGAAVGYLEEAVAGMPTDDPQIALVRHHLALAHEANGDPEQAREELERALRDIDTLTSRGSTASASEGESRPRGSSEPPWASAIRADYDRLTTAAASY